MTFGSDTAAAGIAGAVSATLSFDQECLVGVHGARIVAEVSQGGLVTASVVAVGSLNPLYS